MGRRKFFSATSGSWVVREMADRSKGNHFITRDLTRKVISDDGKPKINSASSDRHNDTPYDNQLMDAKLSSVEKTNTSICSRSLPRSFDWSQYLTDHRSRIEEMILFFKKSKDLFTVLKDNNDLDMSTLKNEPGLSIEMILNYRLCLFCINYYENSDEYVLTRYRIDQSLPA